jgi:hypothetical protein
VLSQFKVSKRVRDAEAKLRANPLKLVVTTGQLFESVMTESWARIPYAGEYARQFSVTRTSSVSRWVRGGSLFIYSDQ